MSTTTKRAGIILAAGLGSRLCGENIHDNCKPLMLVDNISLLIRTIHSLTIGGCDQVIIVLGHQAELVKNRICSEYESTLPIKFVVNHRYTLQNGISVLSAENYVGKEFILTMADHILDDKIMELIRDHHPLQGGATLCVDYKIKTIFDIQDATKVLEKDSRIKKIGKQLNQYNCIDTGVFIGSEGLMKAINEVYQKKGDASLSEGVQLLADKGLMKVLDIKDAFWQDVDNMDMLLHAENLLKQKSEKVGRFLRN